MSLQWVSSNLFLVSLLEITSSKERIPLLGYEAEYFPWECKKYARYLYELVSRPSYFGVLPLSCELKVILLNNDNIILNQNKLKK